MKKTLLSTLFLLSFLSAYGQKERILLNSESDRRKYNFGIQLGLGMMSYIVEPSTYKGFTPTFSQNVNAAPGFGYEITALASYNFHRNFSLRFSPGVYLANCQLSWQEDSPIQHLGQTRELQTFYAGLPLYLRIASNRMNNIKPFAEIGGGALINMTSKQYDGRDNYEGIFRVKPFSGFVMASLGTEIYNHYFKLGISIKGMWGFSNVLIYDYAKPSEYTSPIASMRSSGVFVSFCFE